MDPVERDRSGHTASSGSNRDGGFSDVECALYRSGDSVHLLLHERLSAPTVIQTSFGPWDRVGWLDLDEVGEPLRDRLLDDLASNFYAVLPAEEVPDLKPIVTMDKRPYHR